MFYVAVLLLGLSAGLRTGTPLAVVSVAAALGRIDLGGTWAAFVGHPITAVILSILALLELVGDQLPKAPSRKSPPQFGARIVSGALVGLVIGWPSGSWVVAALAGAIGAIAGTLGGFEARRRLASAMGRDLPAALIEDAVAIAIAVLAVLIL